LKTNEKKKKVLTNPKKRNKTMTNLNCCHLALVLAIANIITLAIFAGYTVKLRDRQFILEKKNGSEQKQIDQLKEEIAQLKANQKKDHE
jgi:cell division protein FtsB